VTTAHLQILVASSSRAAPKPRWLRVPIRSGTTELSLAWRSNRVVRNRPSPNAAECRLRNHVPRFRTTCMLGPTDLLDQSRSSGTNTRRGQVTTRIIRQVTDLGGWRPAQSCRAGSGPVDRARSGRRARRGVVCDLSVTREVKGQSPWTCSQRGRHVGTGRGTRRGGHARTRRSARRCAPVRGQAPDRRRVTVLRQYPRCWRPPPGPLKGCDWRRARLRRLPPGNSSLAPCWTGG